MFDKPESTSIDRLLEIPDTASKVIKDDSILEKIKEEDDSDLFDDYEFIEMIRSELRVISAERAEKGEDAVLTHLPFTPLRYKVLRRFMRLLGWKYFHRISEIPEMVEAGTVAQKDIHEFDEDLDVIVKPPEPGVRTGPEKIYKVEKEDVGQILLVAKRLYFSDLARKIKKNFMPSDIVIGFDIGTEYIKYAQLRKQKDKYYLDRYDLTKISAQDSSAGATAKEQVSLGIQKILPFDLLPIADVVITFSDLEVVTRTEVFPSLEPKELKDAVTYKATKELPESIKTPEVKYEVLESVGSKDAEKLTVMMHVYDKNELDGWLDILTDIGIDPRKVSLPHTALDSSLRRFYPEEYEKGIVIFDFGGRKSQLLFAEHGNIKFIRNISVGVNNFVKALTGPAHIGEDVVEITREKAAKLLRTYGISDPDSLGNTEYRIPVARIGALLYEPIENVVHEIRRSIDFIRSKNTGSNIGSIILIGGGSEIINLDAILEDKVGLPVGRFSIFPKMLIGRDVSEADKLIKDSYMLGNSVGLALDESNDLNILPAEKQHSRKNNTILLGAVSALIITIILLLKFSFDISDELKLIEDDLIVAKETLAAMQPSLNEYNNLVAQTGILENMKAFVEEQYGLNSQNTDYGTFLKILSSYTPPDISINNFQILERKMENVFKDGNYYRALSPFKLVLRGKTQAVDADKSILEYILVLRDLPYFSEVTLQEGGVEIQLEEDEFMVLLIVKG
ncbi:MAG: pilus assembly protein PilM [bacterium]|nr:pilus assembly protein PilM [bacterium]